MQALAVARERIRAKMYDPRTPRPVRMAHRLAEQGRARLIPILSSPLAQDLVRRGYDAWTLSRIYANRPDHRMGALGTLADRIVLDLPIHRGLRERFDAAAGEICSEVFMVGAADLPEIRILSVPSGLACEAIEAARRLRERHPHLLARVRCCAVDPALRGPLLEQAREEAEAAGLRAAFDRTSQRRWAEVSTSLEAGPFHILTCLGLPQRCSLTETAETLAGLARGLAPHARLLIDRWAYVEPSRIADGLGIQVRCDGERPFAAMLERAGFAVEREHPSGEGGCVLVAARRRD